MSLLEVRHISKAFVQGLIFKKKHAVLSDISFSLEAGEMVGLAGTSGAGKTTLIRILMQLLRQDSGTIHFDGREIYGSHDRRAMQLLFQNPASALNPRMKIREALEEPLLIHRAVGKENIPAMLSALQLRQELLDRYPYQLSGGELQRICLARLLLLKPKLLLLDEPTSMLDVSVQAQIIQILQGVQQKTGMACLLISHDLDLLKACCSRIGILHEGRLIEIEKTETLYAYPKAEYTRSLIETFESF